MKAPAEAGLPQRKRGRRGPPFGNQRSYSRFVSLTKRVLPAAAVGMLVLIAVWPRLEGLLQTIRFPLPKLDLSEARDLHMVAARYTGIDRDNRPFVITAEVARQRPKLDDVISLEKPKGDLTTTSGNWLELSADTGLYQPQPQLLDLQGSVILYQDRGTEFHSESAHVDMAASTAEGDAAVTGQGPFGNVKAEGFRILERGDTIIFKGKTQLEILPRARDGQ
jgi:lipopolysaccharide export system protein LptC